MREQLRRLVRDLTEVVGAEAELSGNSDRVVPRAEPRVPKSAEVMARVAAEVKACKRCGLCRGRQNAVPGEGPSDAKLMLIGEAPGQEEDRQGRPFVGPAGDLLTKMLGAIHVPREEAFIANVLKCRPPGNRDPAPDEVALCRRYLELQIEAIRPVVILTLGRFSAQLLLETSQGILRLRGIPRQFKHRGGTSVLVPTLHPAYLLRNAPAKRDAWEDLQLAHRILREKTGDWPPPLSA